MRIARFASSVDEVLRFLFCERERRRGAGGGRGDGDDGRGSVQFGRRAQRRSVRERSREPTDGCEIVSGAFGAIGVGRGGDAGRDPRAALAAVGEGRRTGCSSAMSAGGLKQLARPINRSRVSGSGGRLVARDGQCA